MKIKKLLLENINSLYGRWEIDFTSEAFNDGLFAIMGPTGSGKTTILDAICLALFAETPRIRGGSELLAGEVVSRGTGSCLAEVTFEIDGKDYLARFGFAAYQRNGRNARKGDLNPATMKHKIYCEGKSLCENNSETKRKIEEILGMKVEQFYRTVMLAQGKFDAFLSAGVNRADVLEQITGTEQYTRIARKINEKYRAVQKELDLRQAEQTGYRLLTPEETQAKKTELSALETAAAEKQARNDLLAGQLDLMDRIAGTEKEQQKNREEREELERRKTAFGPDAARLAEGEKAARILPAFQAFSEMEGKLRDNSKQLGELETQLPELARQLEPLVKKADEANQLVRQRSEEQTRLTGLVGQVSALDQEIRQGEARLKDLRKQLDAQQASRKAMLSARQECQIRRRQLEAGREQAESCIAAHPGDNTLAVKQAQWQEQLNQLKTQKKSLQARRNELDKAADSLRLTGEKIDRQTELTGQKEAAVQKALAELKRKQDEVASILQGNTRESLESRKASLTRNLILQRKIQNYEEERRHLAKGEPCPLCGSREHPFAEENRQVLSLNEAELEEIDSRLKKLTAGENAVIRAVTAANEAKTQKTLAENDLRHLSETAAGQRKERDRLAGLLEQENLQYGQMRNSLTDQLGAHGFQWDGSDRLPGEIGLRIEARGDAERKLQEFEKDSARIDTDLDNLSARIDEAEKAAADGQRQIAQQEQELNALKTERNVLFGDKDPQQESQAAARRLSAAQTEFNRVSQEKSRQEEAIRLKTELKNSLTQTVGKQKTEMERRRKDFTAACAAEQLTPERFETARLQPAELTELTEMRTRLREQEQALTRQSGQLAAALAELRAALPGGTVRQTVADELAGLQPEINGLNQQIGALKKDLADDVKKRQDLGELLEQIESLRRNSELWEQLDKLAGGSDGQNFRRIAQQITLGHLLRAANETLRRMNGRYELLVSDSDDMLGIDVLDHLRGEEIRTSANLSGGERFQVSLALALGLSSISGENIHVDSLFLDEGFGTLDPKSLEHALSTLSELRRIEGKTIGIISHVRAIGENIRALIEVTPQGGGRSSLSGAGVSH